MIGTIALNIFLETKGREIIPSIAWCFWRIRNLIVFKGYKGGDEDALFVACRTTREEVRYQVEEFRIHGYKLLQERVKDSFLLLLK